MEIKMKLLLLVLLTNYYSTNYTANGAGYDHLLIMRDKTKEQSGGGGDYEQIQRDSECEARGFAMEERKYERDIEAFKMIGRQSVIIDEKKYCLIKRIGSGGFSYVFEVVRLSSKLMAPPEKFALRFTPASESAAEEFKKEQKVLNHFNQLWENTKKKKRKTRKGKGEDGRRRSVSSSNTSFDTNSTADVDTDLVLEVRKLQKEIDHGQVEPPPTEFSVKGTQNEHYTVGRHIVRLVASAEIPKISKPECSKKVSDEASRDENGLPPVDQKVGKNKERPNNEKKVEKKPDPKKRGKEVKIASVEIKPAEESEEKSEEQQHKYGKGGFVLVMELGKSWNKLGISLDAVWSNLTTRLFRQSTNADEVKVSGQMIEKMLREMLAALRDLHKVAIHLDIAPKNFIYAADGNKENTLILKMIDFGAVEFLEEGLNSDERSDACIPRERWFGTPHYMSPEQFSKCQPLPASNEDKQLTNEVNSDWKERKKYYKLSPKTDIWSLGISLHYFVFFCHPFPELKEIFKDKTWKQLQQSKINKVALEKIIAGVKQLQKELDEKEGGKKLKKKKKQINEKWEIKLENDWTKALQNVQNKQKVEKRNQYVMRKMPLRGEKNLYKKFAEIILNCLRIDPQKRPTALQILNFMDNKCENLMDCPAIEGTQPLAKNTTKLIDQVEANLVIGDGH